MAAGCTGYLSIEVMRRSVETGLPGADGGGYPMMLTARTWLVGRGQDGQISFEEFKSVMKT